MDFNYGSGNGFTWQPKGSNADRFGDFLKQGASSGALEQAGAAYQGAQQAATQYGIAQMQADSNERIAQMQADAAEKAQKRKSSGGFLNGFLGLAGTAASFIPGGGAVAAGLGAAGKLFG